MEDFWHCLTARVTCATELKLVTKFESIVTLPSERVEAVIERKNVLLQHGI
jgi:hypothetical protein